MPGSGKTNLLNAAIAGSLAAGAELAILDLPSKSVDFLWCKRFVRPGGWGCDSPEAAVTVLQPDPRRGTSPRPAPRSRGRGQLGGSARG